MSRRATFILGVILIVLGILLILRDAKAQAPTPVTPPAQCVMVIIMDKDGTPSKGSGALAGFNLVVTAYHVVKDRKSKDCEILFPNWRLMQATVVKIDKKADLCLIRLKGVCHTSPFPLSKQEFWKSGTEFIVMGYGYGPFKASHGSLDRRSWGPWKNVLGAEVRNGDSGGPVLDSQGRYAGTLWGSDKEGTMFTPVDTIREFMR